MITIPVANPALLKTFEADFGTSIAQTLWQRIIDHLNWLNTALPVGSVLYFYASQTYANGSQIAGPGPCWQLCDGAEITDPNSPLVGQFTPNMLGRFLKGSETPDQIGGSDTVNLAHNHGGATGAIFDGENNFNSGGDNEQGGPSFHNHTISTDLGVILRLPPYAELQPYMRIV